MKLLKWFSLAIFALLTLLIILIGWLIFTNGYVSVANYFLSPKWSIEANHSGDLDAKRLSIPDLSIYYHNSEKQSCRLTSFDNIKLAWHQRTLIVDHANLNQQCLTQIDSQSSTTSKPLNISHLASLLPLKMIEVKQFNLVDSPLMKNPLFAPLVKSNILLKLENQLPHVNLALIATEEKSKRAVANLDLELNSETSQLTGHASYTPKNEESNILDFSTMLGKNYNELPEELSLTYYWKNNQLPVKQGKAQLKWEGSTGDLAVFSLIENEDNSKHINELVTRNEENRVVQKVNQKDKPKERYRQLLTVPFTYQNRELTITKSHFQLALDQNNTFNSYLNLTLKPLKGNQTLIDGFPLFANLRLSLVSSGTKGKGVMVIQGKDLIIDKNFNLGLRINGSYKYSDSIAYINTPLNLSGTIAQPLLRFLPSSLIRVTGKEGEFKFQEIRLPLAGVRISRQGVTGRLQAILRGESLQYKDVELHLDGQARNFTAGVSSLFDTPKIQKQSASKDSNYWGWRTWGNAKIAQLGNEIVMRGRGAWHNNVVSLESFNSQLTQFSLSGVKIKPVTLTLSSPLLWNYSKNTISGDFNVHSKQIEFSYGGFIPNPKLDISLNGSSLSQFRLKGQLRAGGIRPILVYNSYDHGDLKGSLYWLKDSAKIFQPLFPQRWKWIIKSGEIKGQVVYSYSNQRGFVSGGHLNIHQGNIILPNGNFSGVDFSLPFRYQDDRFLLGYHSPLTVKIKQLDYGVNMQNLVVNVQGYFPYSRRYPLRLSKAQLELLGGTLNVERLALPQRAVAILRLKNINLDDILTFSQYRDLTIKGSLKAELPFWIENSPCMICDGEISKMSEDWKVKLKKNLVNKLESNGGITEGILVNLLQELNFSEVNAKINLSRKGDMHLTSKVRATNQDGQLINLNYNHHENVFELWNSINFGSQFEQRLDYRLYQRLDERRKHHYQ